MPHASFNKKTAHEIIKYLKSNHQQILLFFKVDEKEREYRIGQRDAFSPWLVTTHLAVVRAFPPRGASLFHPMWAIITLTLTTNQPAVASSTNSPLLYPL